MDDAGKLGRFGIVASLFCLDDGPSLPTKQNEEFRPFIRRLPEFKFWHSATKGVVIAMICTFFEAFNVPVFWPILVMYFIMLFCITMKRQIKHMVKYRYLPFTHGKRTYRGKEDTGKTFATCVVMYLHNLPCLLSHRLNFLPSGYQQLQVMRFAVEEINNSTSLLPNVSLGYEIFDHCSRTQNFPTVFDLLSTNGSVPVRNTIREYHPKVISVTGPFGSTTTITIAPLLMFLFLVSQVTYGATSTQLSDKIKFPSFFRTIPSDKHQVDLIVRLLQMFKWNWVAFLGGDSDYSRDALQFFSEEIPSANICLAYHGMIARTPPEIDQMIDVIDRLKIGVIVLFAQQNDVTLFIQQAVKRNVRNKVLIASEAWSLNHQLLSSSGIDSIGTIIGITIQGLGTLPGFKEFVYRTMTRRKTQTCPSEQRVSPMETCNQLCPQCSGVTPQDIINEDPTYRFSIYSAVYAIAHSLHQALQCSVNGCSGSGPVYPYMVFEKLKKVSFTLYGHTIEFDECGDPSPYYEIVVWDKTSPEFFKKIGSYSPQTQPEFILNKSLIHWHTNGVVPVSVCSPECPVGYKKNQVGHHECCFECEACPNGTYVNYTDTCNKCEVDEWAEEGSSNCQKRILVYLDYTELLSIGLMLSASFLITISGAVAIVFACNFNTPVVKSAGGKMCFFMLGCLSVSCCSVFFYLGIPGREKCLLRNPVFAVFYTACLSCLAVHSFQIVCIFKMAAKLPKAYDFWVKHNGQWLTIMSCVGIQVILCAIWIGVEGPQPFNNTAAYEDQIIFDCSMGNEVAFNVVIIFVGFLSIACFIFSYMGTDLPKNYNEAKSITFSLLIFFLSWISFLTAYMVYKGKYIQAINAISVLSSLYGIVFGYFIPKCYIILYKPEKNTPAHFQTCIQNYTQRISSM
ncbi:TS1R1 protein, partial [Atractosteus spatula]|nr:TS1R1 protein [Atractosteus spatula]